MRYNAEYHPIQKFKVPEPYLWPENVNDVAYNPWTDLRLRKDVTKLKLKFPWEKIPGILRDRYIYFIFKHVPLHFLPLIGRHRYFQRTLLSKLSNRTTQVYLISIT